MSRALVLVVAMLVSLVVPVEAMAQPATRPSTGSQSPDTYVIVHGAWGGGWAFREVDQLLTQRGHAVHRATLTGQGERVHLASPEIGLNTHIDDVVNLILYEDLRDVVLVGHSYGGMIITGVADRVPDRIKHLVYLDALVPENGESANTALGRERQREETGGFIVPRWVRPDQKPPHDVPQSAKTFSDPVELTNQEQASKIPATYILTVDPGRQPAEDGFHGFSQRARERGWTIVTMMETDHNPQWSKPKELADALDQAP